MDMTRRSAVVGALVSGLTLHSLAGCADPGAASRSHDGAQNKTKLHIMGVIHSGHLRSETYSLEVLRSAIREAAPDVVLTEIPPDRIDQALASFLQTDEVDEPRTEVFPEYTDVLFPLIREMEFEVEGTAGWTRAIADERREVLTRIGNDPAREEQWTAYRSAQREFSSKLGRRGDDPLFIHTDAFDALVKEARAPYAEYFGDDLGAGGWTQINRAHTDLINAALDRIRGEGKRAPITFGTAHKYKIIESVSGRNDVELLDTRALFA